MVHTFNKEAYRKFCAEHGDMLFFMQPWWLDIVCGEKNWDVSVAINEAGQIVGALPYFLSKLKFFEAVLMPPLTPFIGPYLMERPTKENTYKLYTSEKKLLDKLIAGLPEKPFFIQQYHYGLTTWLPFYWQGYKQTTRYTYRFKFPFDLDQVFKSLKSSCRNKITKAQKSIKVIPFEDIDLFYKINSKSFERQGKKPPYSIELLRTIDREAKKHKQREMYMAQHEDGNIHAVIYLVSDSHTVYNLMLGADTDLRNSGAVQLLLWKSIQYAHSEKKAFDFEGSMIYPIEKMFRSFGADRVPYFRIYRTKNRFYDLLRWWSRLF